MTVDPVDWLLGSHEPAIRRSARRELLGDVDAQEPVLEGPMVSALLSGQRDDGGFGVHPYRKWSGAHWRLVSLVELGVTDQDERSARAAGSVLRWLRSPQHLGGIVTLDGRTRRCASQEGNALFVCSALGMSDHADVASLADDLRRWQWPDGGWNCDTEPSVQHSSLHETLTPARGLWARWTAIGDTEARDAALRAAELILRHRVFRSERTGAPIDSSFVRLRSPAYWHYGILPALLLLASMGLLADPRAADAMDVLQSKRLPDGRWPVEGAWWRQEVVPWPRTGPSERVTLDALRITAGSP